ncbi:myomegalin isoform X3 [Xenopus laevis]|uniref:Myomegalin isoform X3 n=1 Tax=Xenopus laevis TaxID=8355 RepID=A0A8J1MYQ5_XENLA|nr:myomegalin isoform X3 [Xenopus laevis]
MKESCRICGRELCGNQRRWIFHTASKLNLQVLLSHVLGRDVSRDGKAEFACSKCAFMLERMCRFDTVIARIEALSIERLQKLISEKERLKHCLAGLYRRNNSEEDGPDSKSSGETGTVDISELPDVRYSALLQDDFAYSGSEYWADLEEQEPQHCPHTDTGGLRPRRCRCCSGLRVADSDYEAVCKVPRKVARGSSCGPSTKGSAASVCTEETMATQPLLPPQSLTPQSPTPESLTLVKAPHDAEGPNRMSSGSSAESLTTHMDSATTTATTTITSASPLPHKEEEPDKPAGDDAKCDCCSIHDLAHSPVNGAKSEFAFLLAKVFNYKPVQIPRGCRIPVKSRLHDFKSHSMVASGQSVVPSPGLGFLSIIAESPPGQDFLPELYDVQDLWQDVYEEYMPIYTQNLLEKQHQNVSQCEVLSAQHVSDLQALQGSLQETEASNKMLQESLHQVTAELNSARELSCNQERIIQSLRETLQSRDSEVADLYHIVEGHNDTIVKLQNMLQKSQTEQLQASQMTPSQQQLQLLDLQNTLFCTQRELQKQQRTLRQKERQLTDLKQSQGLLETDLLEGQQQKETTWKHNQELHGVLHKLQTELQEKSQLLQNTEEEKCTKLHAQGNCIQQLQQTLAQKEQLLQEYVDLLKYQQSLGKHPVGSEHMLDKLRQRIKDRDEALEHAVDDKFGALEEKEKEIQQLKMIIREKQRDLERLQSVLSGNEETINSLDNLMKSKDVELEHISAAYKNLEWLKQSMEEKNQRSLKERESIIQQLQQALQERSKEIQEMTTAFLQKSEIGSFELIQELQACLEFKEKMLQEAFHDRSQQADEHMREMEELLTSQLEKYKPLSEYPVAVCVTSLSAELKAPDAQSNQTEMLESELAKAKDDLQLVLRKERENQIEVSALQSMIREQSEQLQEQAADMDALSRNIQIKEDLIKDLQMQLVDPEEVPTVDRLTQQVLSLKEKLAASGVPEQEHGIGHYQKLSKLLEELVADRGRLNDALHAEKQLYSSLVQFHSDPDSIKRTSALQEELLTAQKLTCQLEDALERATDRLSQLDSERGLTAITFGGLKEDNELDEDSSSQFSDSIEDEIDDQSSGQGTVPQVTVDAMESVPHVTAQDKNLQNELVSVRSKLQQVMEVKAKTEEELKVLKSRLEEAGISDAADIRNVLQILCQKRNEWNVEMESEKLGQWEDETMEEGDSPVEEGLRVELRRLQGKMRQAETVIKHLKEQLALNSKDGMETFNPDLIVSMAVEIERLKMEKASATTKRSAVVTEQPKEETLKRHCNWQSSGDTGEPEKSGTKQKAHVSQEEPDSVWQDTGANLEDQTMQLRSELAQSMRQNQELQDKLVMKEATVHEQTDQLNQYRGLLNEPLVERDSKQVQVGFQDLGYETCGRSENEVDREESTSPEYEEHEDMFSENSLMEEQSSAYKGWSPLVTSTPLKNNGCVQNDWTLDWEKSEDVTVLQQHVKNLKVQLQKAQKVISNLQSRARSFSASSDYANHHRLKHSVSFHGSTSHSITDEDEGWQSDTVGVNATKDLEQLVQRVSMLEAQLHQSHRDVRAQDQMKSATWPGKYDSLIQAQARELSLLRQKLREGRSVCHILTQHLGDTIKSFEELLRANDIDYYMGQGFREQLTQGNQLAERLNNKLNSKERSDVDDKSRHELLAIRLSKELQQKDKIIESLQSKLEGRSMTPSSSHAISESDQSDRTSFVSDDQLSNNDDLDGCSEVATASDYIRSPHVADAIHIDNVASQPTKPSLSTSHEVQQQRKLHANSAQAQSTETLQGHFNLPPSSVNAMSAALPPNPPFPPFGVHPPMISGPPVFSLAEVQQELHTLQKQLAESMPMASSSMKPAQAATSFFDTTASSVFPSYFPQPLHDLPSTAAPQNAPDLRTAEPGFSNSSGLWDMQHLVRPVNGNVHGDASSGSSGYQSASKLTGSDLLEEHLAEIRNLRQRLEQSIHMNDRLRAQLEDKLTAATKGAPTNIYIQGLESLPQLSNENRALREENLSLQVRINQISRDYFKELENLQELLSSSRAQLKNAETDLEQKTQESKKLQEELDQKQQEILNLQTERQSNQEKCNRLQHQATLLEQQLNENCQLVNSLQSELQVYERLLGSSKLVLSGTAFSGETYHSLPANYDFSELLSEVRSLRSQMEKSIQINTTIRHHLEKQLEGSFGAIEMRPSSISIFPLCEHNATKQLFQDPIPSPPVRDVGMHSPSTFFPSSSFLNASHTTPVPDLSLLNKTQETSCNAASVESKSQKLEGDAPDGSFANKNGRHVIGHIDDFAALKQQILEGKMLIQKMETIMQSSLNITFLEIHGIKALDYGSIKRLFSTTSTLHQILKESSSLLGMFWRAALPNTQSATQQKKEEQAMKEEICQLKNKLKEQEVALQEALEHLKSTNRAKESMEHFIVSQLTRTHDVLKKAKSNLEPVQKNSLKVSSGKPLGKGSVQQRSAKLQSHLMDVFQEPPRKKPQLKSIKCPDHWACHRLIQATQ